MTPQSTSLPCLFFGTFNPIHWGHLMMAQTALNHFGFEEILFIPTGQPPHRQQDADLLPALDRFNMVELAIADHPRFRISDVEFKRPGPSYTMETLIQLKPRYFKAADRIPLIIGTDALSHLATWHRAEELAQTAWFLQACRDGQDLVTEITVNETPIPLTTDVLPMPPIGLSSTWIRQQLAAGHPLRYAVPNLVAGYIKGKHA